MNIYAPGSWLPLHKTSRIITKADKGNLVVVLDRAEYLQKTTPLLSNTIYKPLLMDPTDISRKSLRSLLVSFAGETNDLKLTTIATHLKYPGYYNAPELYGLLKMHKAGVPFRPIVSTINSATSELSRYLKQIIRPLTGKEPSFIRNSKSLVNEIKEMSLNPDEILVSCDVKGLFPSIPISHTLAVLHNLLINDESLPSRTELNPFHIITLTSFCMQEGNYFQFDNKFYQQVNGAPLGSPLSPVLAEVFLESFERTVFQTVDTQIAPRLFKPYVDDVFAIMKQGREEQFLNFLNSIFPNQISFTIEEENNTLPFFDILIMRTTKGLKAKVYRKPTHTDQYIHFTSDHPKSVLHSLSGWFSLTAVRRWFISMLNARGWRICPKDESLEKNRGPPARTDVEVVLPEGNDLSSVNHRILRCESRRKRRL
ncbi:hypothetical protein M514_05966, partial [Trichuris suis]